MASMAARPSMRDPLFVAFAVADAQLLFVELQVGQIEGLGFAGAQAGGVEQFHQGFVAEAVGGGGVGGVEQRVRLRGRRRNSGSRSSCLMVRMPTVGSFSI